LTAASLGSVRILRLAAGGDGVGRLPDGRTVFVPRTAPGDLVELQDLRLSRSFARARAGTLTEVSSDRVEARCPHYLGDACGGCQLQHLTIEAQRTAKRSFVGDALRRLAKLDLPDPEIEPAPEAWGYRTKITLTVRDAGRRIGFHRQGRPDEIFPLRHCDIAAPALMKLWNAIRASRDLLPPDATHLVLRVDRSGGLHLLVQVKGQTAWSRARELHDALGREAQHAVLWWQPEGGAARAVAGAPTAYPATAFEQVNPEMGDRVRQWAVRQLGDISGCRAWDLYAGVGETTALLAGRGARIESVESARLAVEEAERRGDAPGAVRHVGRAEDLVPRLPLPDVVVTNPPRTGMDARVVEAIRVAAPRRIAYVSCDPATLARDLSRMLSRVPASLPLRVAAVRAFDLFPQTAHVETVVILERTA
jgi:23S rRNA (uracil1939-C5)-methyltransferase